MALLHGSASLADNPTVWLHVVVLLWAGRGARQLPCNREGLPTHPALGCSAPYLQGDLGSFQQATAQKGTYFAIESSTLPLGCIQHHTFSPSKYFVFSVHMLGSLCHSSLHTRILARLMWIGKYFLLRVFGCVAGGKRKEPFWGRRLRWNQRTCPKQVTKARRAREIGNDHDQTGFGKAAKAAVRSSSREQNRGKGWGDSGHKGFEEFHGHARYLKTHTHTFIHLSISLTFGNHQLTLCNYLQVFFCFVYFIIFFF